MRHILAIALLVLVGIAGAFLLGRGITGMVTMGQSCCFGPDCPAELLCDAAEPTMEYPQFAARTHLLLVLGGLLIALVVLLIAIHTQLGKSSSSGKRHNP